MAFKLMKKEVDMIVGIIKITIESEVEFYENYESFIEFNLAIYKIGHYTLVDTSKKGNSKLNELYEAKVYGSAIYAIVRFSVTDNPLNCNDKKVINANFTVYDEKLATHVVLPFDIASDGVHNLFQNFFEILGYTKLIVEKENYVKRSMKKLKGDN